MNAFLKRWRSLLTPAGRPYAALLVFLLLLGATRLIEWAYVRHAENNFDTVVDDRCAAYLQSAVGSFVDVQRAARRAATEAATLPAVVDYLTGRDTSRVDVFQAVIDLAESQQVSLELYDRTGSLICWEGRGGPAHPREVRLALDGQMTSYVTATPIASQLFVTIPVRAQWSILGAVMVRRTIDVNYPLNNRYIRREGLTTELASLLGVNIEFNFSPDAQPRKDGRYASAVLYGIDSSHVGVVSLMRPPRASFLESMAQPFENATTLFAVGVIVALAVIFWRSLHRPFVPSSLRIPGVIVIIWGVRVALLFFDVGSLVTINTLFNPALFASQFGGGIARSLGDMTLSVAALAFTTWYLLSQPKLFLTAAPDRSVAGQGIWWKGACAVIIGLVLLWFLRGFGALARGVVFDSTIHLNDPRQIFPDLELSVMMANALCAAVCLILVGALGIWAMLRLVSPGGNVTRISWIIVALVMIVLSWVFGQIQETPLMELWHRILFSVVILAGSWGAMHVRKAGRSLFTWRSLVLLLIGAMLLYYPLIDLNIRDKDRDRVEGFAREAVRPIDNWMSLVVDDGLDGMTSNDVVERLTSPDSSMARRLAFVRWAQSVACREGYASLFEFTDTTGKPFSKFAIGSQIQVAMETDTVFVPSPARVVAMREIGSGIAAFHVYYGSSPVIGFHGELLAYARVLVAAGPQSLFRGETPGVLRPAGPEGLRSFYRPVTVSEYHDGVVVSSNNPNVPLRRTMPSYVDSIMAASSAGWFDELIGDTPVESYYIRRPETTDDVVALSLQDPGVEWHLVGLVRLIGFSSVIVLVVIGIALLVRKVRGGSFELSFRGRLLTALLVTAMIPLAVSTIYNRYYSRERHMAATSTRLSDYTLGVAENLPVKPDSLLVLAPDRAAVEAEEAATDVGTDFNLYAGPRLVMTSRPELFDAGILSRRLNGDAYLKAYIQGNRFFVETERIGVYEYAVGYRPVTNDDGDVEAVIAVPMLFRMDDLNEVVAGRSAFFFAVYFVVIAGLIVLAMIFASRIAAPVQALTEATRRVAKGDLNVHLGNLKREGEIGELMRSFEQMAAELKESRESLVRAERELAWKEMARQVAHEIKNPLTPMRLAVQHLRVVYREGSEDFKEVFEEVTRTLVNQIDTLSRIASEFSHFGRMPRPQRVRCSLNEVVRNSVKLFEQEKNISFDVRLAESLPNVLADPDELGRAFVNILRNSAQAMNNRGKISVVSRLAGDAAEVQIRDTGPGIPEEMKANLFQPNFSTKTEGMGLGLAIVKKTIDDHEGSISITSETGHGTAVTIRIPLAKDSNGDSAGERA